jgi:diacylglycerol kinase (ATP)
VRIDLIVKASDPEPVEMLRTEVARFRELGHEVHVHLTFEAGDGVRFAREAAEAGSELVIAAGGDGTLNEAANGLHEYLETRGPTRSPPPGLAVVPLGTANDLANTLGVPGDVPAALDAALRGRAREVDVARVNGRCFLNVSTGGFGAEATEETSSEAKQALGTLAYLISAARKFVRLEPTPARFVAGEILYDGPFLLFAVGNWTQTGGGNLITPVADPRDGMLDLCIVTELPRARFLALLPDVHAGQHLDHEAVLYHRVPRLLVESGETLTVNADGESLHGRSFRYEISQHRLLLVEPPGEAEGSGSVAA